MLSPAFDRPQSNVLGIFLTTFRLIFLIFKLNSLGKVLECHIWELHILSVHLCNLYSLYHPTLHNQPKAHKLKHMVQKWTIYSPHCPCKNPNRLLHCQFLWSISKSFGCILPVQNNLEKKPNKSKQKKSNLLPTFSPFFLISTWPFAASDKVKMSR